MEIDKSYVLNTVHTDSASTSGWTDFAVDHNFNQYPDLVRVYRNRDGEYYCDQELYPYGDKVSDLYDAEGDDTLSRCYVPVRNSGEGPVAIKIEVYTLSGVV